MSVVIDNTDDLLELLKKLNLKIESVDELRHLLTVVNTAYNPEAARARIAKLVGLVVPIVLGGIAGFVSMILISEVRALGPHYVGALSLVWGVCGLVSLAALLFSFILLARRGAPRVPADNPPAGRPPARLGALVDAITDRVHGWSAPEEDHP
jgi:hypothetical protein